LWWYILGFPFLLILGFCTLYWKIYNKSGASSLSYFVYAVFILILYISNMLSNLNYLSHFLFFCWFPTTTTLTSSSGTPTNLVNLDPYSDHLTNPANPIFLHPGENPALVLVFDNNYSQWQHGMLVVLETKNNYCFVIDTLPCPPLNDPLHETWKRCNKMVIRWLTRSMRPTTIYYADRVCVWYMD